MVIGIWSLGFGISSAAPPLTVTLLPEPAARRYVIVEASLPPDRAPVPARVVDAATGAALPCRWDTTKGPTRVAWVVPHVPAGASTMFRIEAGVPEDVLPAKAGDGVRFETNPDGTVGVLIRGREVTRLHPKAEAVEAPYRKPYFQPILAPGDVEVTRGFPADPKPGETQDHPHHVAFFFAHGDVNGVDFWHKNPIRTAQVSAGDRGRGFATLHFEAEWASGTSVFLKERREVRVLDVAPEVVLDVLVELTALADTVTFGKTKEGGFSIRLADFLTEKAGTVMVDSEGRRGEKEIWSKSAAWVDYSGTFEGKKVGVAMMAHPEGFRSPPPWHARGYGLFASNVFMHEPHTIRKGESIALRHRIYVHAGDAAEAKVAEVHQGYLTPIRLAIE